jgi:hypothetical protein
MKARNPVPAYAPTDGKSFANSPIEGMIRSAAGQGTYTPPIVAKLNGLGSGLNSLFGGSNQASQGSAPAPGDAAPATASPADAAPPPPPPASDSQASAGGGTNSGDVPLPPPRPNDLGTPVADASSSGPNFFDSLKGLFGSSNA